MNRAERTQIFVQEIWQWYARHKRDLPWRDVQIEDDTQRAYQIMLSEIMLQQTQVSRVKIVYKNFLERFPTIQSLSDASNKDVILAWRGMGYNSRALRLRDAAKTIVAIGVFPNEMKALMQIPGIGHYTAAAIRNFAFDIPTPCIDTNIRRILHRVFVGPENSDGSWEKDDRYLLGIAEEVLAVAIEKHNNSFFRFFVSSNQRTNEQTGFHRLCRPAADWHAALMDFGSLVCTKRNPHWETCPLTQKGIMKAAYKVPTLVTLERSKREPGRMIASKYVPNRIIRGKVIEELRDTAQGLPLHEIGKRVCIDWQEKEHSVWLQGIINSLKKDHLVVVTNNTVVLKEY